MTETGGIVTFGPTMSSIEAESRPEGRPSVFLSYASEDRAAVRKLRDTLQAAGVDAWYDENELTGGDAWDVKIRRQIRECTYFMPVISARASARLEGYFRREWRLALERMLDMADDVVFLLPIVIDDLQENTARVPEKFLTVQWMRVSAGDATTAFQELARRLAASGPERPHHAPASRPAEKGAVTRPPQYQPPVDTGLPHGWWPKLGYFWRRLPRWVRITLWITLIITLLNFWSNCSYDKPTVPDARKPSRKAQSKQPMPTTVGLAQEVAAELRQASVAAPSKRPADVVLLAASTKGDTKSVLIDLYSMLITVSDVNSKLNVDALQEGETSVARAQKENARYALLCELTQSTEGKNVIRVALVRSADGATVWTADYAEDESPKAISAQAYAQILPVLVKRN